MPDATAVITAMPADAATAVAAVDSAELRVRPEPATWSVIEYLCHLRDVAITTTIRLHRARTEDRPALEPMLNDLRARRFRYADADPHATLAELGRIVGGVSDEIAKPIRLRVRAATRSRACRYLENGRPAPADSRAPSPGLRCP
jgi:hypothetical protein